VTTQKTKAESIGHITGIVWSNHTDIVKSFWKKIFTAQQNTKVSLVI